MLGKRLSIKKGSESLKQWVTLEYIQPGQIQFNTMHHAPNKEQPCKKKGRKRLGISTWHRKFQGLQALSR